MSDDESYIDNSIFDEPEDFRPSKPQPKDLTFKRTNGEIVNIRLIGESPLYGHILTHAGQYIANYLDEHSAGLIENKTVLEVGAGGALPSIICGLNKASRVVSTDYPDPELISNIQYNIENNGSCIKNSVSKGYIWGNDTEELVDELAVVDKRSFDLIILSDVIFNHTEQDKLLKTCKNLITPLTEINDKKSGGKVLVIFSPHRPHLLDDDLDFFRKAKEDYSFDVEFIEMQMWSPLFKNDTDESTREIRSRVYSYVLYPTW